MLLPSRVPRCTGLCTTAPAVHMISGSGKIIPVDVIRRLTVEERSVVYIEFINHYKPKHSISVWKTDPAGKLIPTGASFELYLADDFDDTTQKPKENAEVIASGTTGENGILSLGKLAEGEYRLLETKAPAGYILPESAIKITITETQISAMLGNSNLQINVKGDEDWVEEDQADDTHQIRVWNNPGAVLPTTGGCGTSQIYLLGAMLTGIAGLWLVMRQRRKQLL